MKNTYKKILLKLSGELFHEEHHKIFDFDLMKKLALSIKEVQSNGSQIGIVVGAGNILRGREINSFINPIEADFMGMTATNINALALKSALEQVGVPTKVLSTIPVADLAEPIAPEVTRRSFEEGKVVIFAGGTGNPFFTTDTAAALRALEIHADVLFKITGVGAVYSDDPKKNPDAIRYTEIEFDEVITQRLKVMDATAFAMCRDNNLPILVFNLDNGNLVAAAKGKSVGTFIYNKN